MEQEYRTLYGDAFSQETNGAMQKIEERKKKKENERAPSRLCPIQFLRGGSNYCSTARLLLASKPPLEKGPSSVDCRCDVSRIYTVREYTKGIFEQERLLSACFLPIVFHAVHSGRYKMWSVHIV